MKANPGWGFDLGLPRPVLWTAVGLALACAVSLGLARFAYSLLLPSMRADLGWTYATAGLMNTVNAAGYLMGALLLPRWQARFDGRSVVLAGGLGAAVTMALHAATTEDSLLLVLRTLSGISSAASFAGGGLLAARLAQAPGVGERSGLVLGLYYGGTGLGIIVSALVVPAAEAWGWGWGWDSGSGSGSGSGGGPDAAQGWRTAWVLLGLVGLVATALTLKMTRSLAGPPVPPRQGRSVAPVRAFLPALVGYLMFGLGYIGYMTFIVALARDQGLAGLGITAFYALLGAGVVASSWLWAGLLQRHRGGRPLAQLNGLLALATALPVVVVHPAALFASGALFGSVFLSVVASTTALVRHNLEPQDWPSGIAAFTIVFAGGQIVGPTLVGWVADAWGTGLDSGFVLSAGLLALGSVLATFQAPLSRGGRGGESSST